MQKQQNEKRRGNEIRFLCWYKTNIFLIPVKLTIFFEILICFDLESPRFQDLLSILLDKFFSNKRF